MLWKLLIPENIPDMHSDIINNDFIKCNGYIIYYLVENLSLECTIIGGWGIFWDEIFRKVI